MAECGNMPDWHPYNPPPSGRPSAPTGAQNASTGHMFISSISPPALDGMNLSTESRHQSTKHQSDASAFVPRNYQPGGPIPSSNCPTSSTLTSGVHMTPLSGCVSHYGSAPTRNAMMDGLGSSIDPRMVPVTGITDEVSHRNSQMPFPGPTNHPNASSLNVNAGNPIHGATMAPQNSPVGPMSPGRQPPGFGPCKGPCCNHEGNIPYQHWDKFGHYHGAPNASAYRDNIRQPAYPIDNRRFLPEMNLRKDCLDGKELEGPASFPVEHRRNYPDYKYRKDNVLPRNYPSNGNNLMQNYPMQNYNFPNEYQKCPYSVKDYMRRGGNGAAMNSKNSGMLKYQEQQNAIAQQKYQHSKMQYQNGSVMPNGMENSTATGNIASQLQNSYYNSGQMPRDYSRDYQQEQSVVNNRMSQPSNSHVHGSFQKYHPVYHQKIAMQRYSMENHLRAYSRIPGYQSHPKYQECVMRYRELLRLQQTVDYQNVLQEAPKIPSPSNPAPVAPINLQFDQNGILINSNYIPPGYSGIHSGMNPIASTEGAGPSGNGRMSGATNLEAGNQFVDHTEPMMNLSRDLDNQLHQNAGHENPERYFMTGEKTDSAAAYRTRETERRNENESLNSINVDETTKVNEHRAGNSSGTPAANDAANSETEYKNSKDFADKPELDVRQFLANWDESEDEDAAATNMPDVRSSDSTAERFEEAGFASKSGENCSPQADSGEGVGCTENKEDDAVLASGEGQLVENSTETTTISQDDSPNDAGGERETVTKEIQCIRTDDGVDDIPTIHIVDSLEGGSEIEKIHTVFGSLASAVLNPISVGENAGEAVGEGETIVLFEQGDGVCSKTLEFSVSSEGNSSEVVEGVIASIIDSTTVETTPIVDSAEKSAYKSPEIAENPANDQQDEQTSAIASSSSSGSSYTTTNSVASSACSSKSNSDDSSNLPKQNSFTSDESHNPDDISLPDLQTSECTPISTTLNTPIHSDSEESSEHVTDLTISTNPIEIIQNSPIISFTHSPIKIEPYEQLDSARMSRQATQREHDSLDFDFDREVAVRENEKYNETTEASEASVVDGLESGDRNSGDSMLLEDIREPSQPYNEKNQAENENDEFYSTADPLVGMTHISKSNDQPESTEVPETSDVIPSAENIDSRGEEPVERILTNDQLDTDKCPTILEREDDFNRSEDLAKLCDMSLDGSCIIPLIPEEEDCDEPRMPVPPMEGNCLTKILNDTLPITNLDVLESSDEDKLDKPEDDMWVEVRFMDKHLDGSSAEKTKSELKKVRKAGKSTKIRPEKSSPTKLKHHTDKIDDTSQEMTAKSNIPSELDVEERIPSLEAETETPGLENSQKDKTVQSTSAESPKSTEKEHKEERSEESRKSKDFARRRISRDEKHSEESSRDFEEEKLPESSVKNTITTSFSTKHRDSNVEIQVANLNLKIHDNEVIRNDSNAAKSKNQDSSGDSVDAIEIKINLSRDVLGRRNNKFVDDDRRVSQETPETRDNSPQARENVCPSRKKCCRRRRRSMPEGFEAAKRTRKNDDDRAQTHQHYTAKKIKSRSRHKVRKSMDDELLMSQERSRKESVAEERNFHLELAKTFNLPWQRDEALETGDSCSTTVAKDDETKKDKKSTSAKSWNDNRADKHAKDTRTVPSPSYNSSMENSSTLDFDNFDVAPHHSSDTDPEQGGSFNDARYGKPRSRLEDRDRYRNPTNYGSSFDELASLDAFEINFNTVPIYTTKDGRITYSPNRNYTYKALIMEARQREGHPPIRQLHYPRHLTKSHYRENNERKIYKKRYADERIETKRRGVDYHSGKSKRTTSTRHHVEETDARGARLKKHDSRRKETRISPELEYCSDEQMRGYAVDCSASKSRSSDAIPASFKPEAHKNVADLEPVSRRTEVCRVDDGAGASKHSATNYKGPCAAKNVIDSMTSPKHFANREPDDSIVSKLFQGEEFEISTRKVAADCEERLQSGRENCGRNSRFFQDSQLSLKTPMASPLINLEKRPVGWDLEQDCQTVLSDSGLESSTTYVEASKESRRIQRCGWKNSFVDKVEINRAIYSNNGDNEYEAIDLSHDKTQEKASRYFDAEPMSLRIREDEKQELVVEATTNKRPENENPVEADLKETSSINVEEKIEEFDTEKLKIVLAMPKPSVEPEIHLDSNNMSRIVKSLDLAMPTRHPGIFQEVSSEIEREKVSTVKENRAAQIFRRDRDVNSLMSKVSEALLRRASSDDVDSRESRNFFFQASRLPEIEETKAPEVRIETPVLLEEVEKKIVEEIENQDSQMTMNEIERPATPEIRETPCKDFLIDTSTSFSSCLKLRVPEPVSDMPTESEASQLEDTSTRFASDSMDFKEISQTSNLQGNFSFSSQGIINSSAIDDTAGRDSFFSNITEDAMIASDDCSRRNSELAGESRERNSPRAKDSPEKAPILSFSGQIHDSRHDDSPSKSPPCLMNENSIPKLAIIKSESPKSSPKHPLEISRESVEEDDRKHVELDQDFSLHPKIPKMIIRNVRSRPGTPIAVEEVEETRSLTKEEKLFEVEIKLDIKEESREECKVPKMKIKLEDKQPPRMILQSPKSLEIGLEATKNFPKVKIRRVRRSSTSRSPIRSEKLPLVGKLSRQSSETDMQLDFPENMDNSNASSSYKFTLIEKSSKTHNQSSRVEKLEEESKQDRIPKLTIKKQEVTGSGYSSSSSMKKRRSRSPGESSSRKRKGTSRHGSNKKEETRSLERRTNSLDNEGNTDSQSLSEKIPKVIIKRTSPSAEFKCELSKVGREAITNDSKWQPEVKLQRSWVLDCMAKEPGNGKFALKMLESSLDSKELLHRKSRKNHEWKRSVSDCDLDKSQHSAHSISNNRRRSLDEFVTRERRISREKETSRQGNYEINECSSKSRKLSSSVGNEDDEKARNSRKGGSGNGKISGNGETAKNKENATREKLGSNESSKNASVSAKSEKHVGNDEENEGSVIKLDSSDESQTTIEILPASPDNSQPELDIMEQTLGAAEGIGCGAMGKLYSDDAIPTQFELELEIVDNSTVDSLDVPMPMPGDTSLEDDSTSTVENLNRLERFKPYHVNAYDENVATDLGCEKFVYSDESISLSAKSHGKSSFDVETNAKIICCSDSLVKEVLAAKETLKRCLTKSKSVARPKLKPRPKTAAEKKQGSGFNFVGLSEFAKTSKCDGDDLAVFHSDGKSSGNGEATVSVDKNARVKIKDERTTHNSQEKQDKSRKSWSNERRTKEESVSSSTSSKTSKRSAPSSTNVGATKTSGKSTENDKYGENSRTKSSTSSEGSGRSEKISKHRSSVKSERIEDSQQQQQCSASKVPKVEDSSSKMKSYKIPKISRAREMNGSEDAAKVDKRKTPSPTIMPVLEPQVHLNFEIAGSDRDTSRSPPVITKQEEHDIPNELPKKIEENVHSDKLDSITKQDSEAVTFADIVSQLAYHEKATIRHRRYCTLCERWFPTAARHRRHLTGYQHRHTELTQRRTVHALFMLFTGKPCPRLLPASIVRTDCLPGEPTPLQIAVQDVAISLEDGARVKPKDVSEKDD